MLVESEKRKESDLLKLQKKIKQEKVKIEKILKVRKKKKEDLEKEIKELEKKLKYHSLSQISYRKNETKRRSISYSIEVKLAENTEKIQREKQEAGKFILATNILNKEVLSSEKILE